MDPKQFIPQILASLKLTAPMLVLMGAALAVLVADVLLPRSQRWALALVSMIGVGAAFFALHLLGGKSFQIESYAFSGALRCNYLIFLAHNIILGGALFLILISPRYLHGRAIPQGEYYALLLFATLAMMALAASSELLTLFLNIELLSITLYILAGIEKKNLRSSEAAFKYFLLGSFAAAFLLFGIAFVFGATGQTRYSEIAAVIAAGKVIQPVFLAIGFGLMIVGFAFKLTLAPFHMYAPDVYEGAPTPIAAAIATGSKVAGFVAFFSLVRLMAGWTIQSHGQALQEHLTQGLWVALYAVAVASMVIGNLGAVVQPNIKRMLAYSSIAHSAYIMIPMVVLLRRPDLLASAQNAVAYYLLAYTAMTLLAFGVVGTLGPLGESKIAYYAGLSRRAPVLTVLLTLALLSLTGIPPTVGFFGKFQLFAVAIEGGHIRLAVIGVLASVASAFYYLRVTVSMYMEEPSAEAAGTRVAPDSVNYLALLLGGLSIFALVFFPGLYLFGS